MGTEYMGILSTFLCFVVNLKLLFKKKSYFLKIMNTHTYKTFLEFFLENLYCCHLINYVAQSGITAFKTQGYSLQL